MEKIKYLGHIIDKDGRRPDPKRATILKDMPALENVSSLQSFLGLENYCQAFIPNMPNLRAPLNELLKKDKDWEWTPECQEAFVQIKEVLTLDLFLTHFNPDLYIIVASDVSSYSIGAYILHKMPNGSHKPVAHASRTLLPAEKNYSQIEKESLGIIFGLRSFTGTFIVDSSHCRRTINHYFPSSILKKVCLCIQQIDFGDKEQSF